MFSRIIPQGRQTGAIEYIIAGLGNPGPQYANTRHNAGFLCIDKLADEEHITIDRVKFNALTADAEISGHRCLLMKPQTYMNLSGEAVAKAAKFYKIPAAHIIIIADDISLAPGRMRIRRNGFRRRPQRAEKPDCLPGNRRLPPGQAGRGRKAAPRVRFGGMGAGQIPAEGQRTARASNHRRRWGNSPDGERRNGTRHEPI